MVVTDDERRAAAEWLRGEIGSGYYWPGLSRMSEALGVPDPKGPGYTGRLLGRLADLIEPSEPKIKCVAEVKVDGERLESLVHDAAVELTGIDCDALLALAEAMDGHARDVSAGRNYVDSRDLNGYARRIRETLGGAR